MTFISTPGTSGVSDPNTVRKLLAPDPDTVCAPATGATSTRPTSTLAAIARNRATWRMLPILASLAWLAWGGLAPGRAAAHTCVTPMEVIVGQPATVTVGVAAEGVTPVEAIEITIPEGFVFDSFVPSGEWQGTLDGDVLSLRGGQIAGGACGFLLLKGTATQGGTLHLPMRTTDQDGTVRDLDRIEPFHPLSAMVVEAQVPGGPGGGGIGAGAVALLVGLAAMVVAVVVVLARRSRRGPIRKAGPDGTRGERPVVYPARPSRKR